MSDPHRPPGPPGQLPMHGGMPDNRTYFDSRAPPTRKRTGDGEPPTKKIKEELPSVLVREKKQKACANCRRAKLKCIVNDGNNECVRCLARKERCVFYPRGHDEDYQQTLANDLNAIAVQAQHLTRAMHHVLHHMMAQNGMPPLDPPLPTYEAPERDPAAAQGWGGERNRGLSKKRNGSSDDAFTPYNGASFMRPADMHVGMPMPPNGTQNGPQDGPIPVAPPQDGAAMAVLGGLVSFEAPRAPNDASISPVDTASFVPASHSQASVMGTPSLTGGAFGLLSAPRPSVSPEDAVTLVLPPDHDQFGASDPRPNIVKRGVISNDEATALVAL